MVVADKALTNVMRDLESYFQVSSKMKRPNEPVAGIASSVLQLVSMSNENNILGKTEAENSMIYQWLEYASLYSPYFFSKSQLVTQQVLKELDGVLSRQSFLVKNNCTVADIVMFYLLWNTVSSLTFHEKEQYISVARWFNTLQQDEKIRRSKQLICFSRTLLYQ